MFHIIGFLLARKFHLDAYSTARAGLLHDLYFYDWREKDTRPMEGRHCSIHPQIALENAKKSNEDQSCNGGLYRSSYVADDHPLS